MSDPTPQLIKVPVDDDGNPVPDPNNSNTVMATAAPVPAKGGTTSTDDGFNSTLPYIAAVGVVAGLILIILGVLLVRRRRRKRLEREQSNQQFANSLLDFEGDDDSLDQTPEQEIEDWLHTEEGMRQLVRVPVGAGWEECEDEEISRKERRYTAMSEGLLADASLGQNGGDISPGARYDDVEEIYGRV